MMNHPDSQVTYANHAIDNALRNRDTREAVPYALIAIAKSLLAVAVAISYKKDEK